MLVLRVTGRFKKDLKKAVKQGKGVAVLDEIVEKLRAGSDLEEKYRDHALGGDFVNHRECHIRPDWLLIYKVTKNDLILVRTGSHSELFD